MKTLRDYLSDESFTERAHLVLKMAYQEAQRFNHEYIGTEHLLLGLAKEGSGVGAWALKAFGIELQTIRNNVELIVGSGTASENIPNPQITHLAVEALEQSRIEAKALDAPRIGTEHILLGLLKAPTKSVAHETLERHDALLQLIIERVLHLLSNGPNDNNLVIQRNEDGTLVFSAKQVKELLGGEFPDSGACAGYQTGFSFGQCEYHLIGNQFVPYMGGLPADGPNFQLTLVSRPT